MPVSMYRKCFLLPNAIFQQSMKQDGQYVLLLRRLLTANNFSQSPPGRYFWQGLHTIIIRMYLVTTKSHYCSGNKSPRECHWNRAQEASVITSAESFKKIIVLYRTIPNDTLLSTFRFCAHLLDRNNMQNGCLLFGVIVIFVF